jgi:prephenate dehydratase
MSSLSRISTTSTGSETRSHELDEQMTGVARSGHTASGYATLGYLGPAGTFAEEASVRFDPTAELLPCPSIPAVAKAVEAGLANAGVVPVENSLEGAVTFTADLLIHDSDLSIHDELVLSIHHNLLASPGTSLGDISVVYSHPQALAQCAKYLHERLPDAKLVASLSTSGAVESLATRPGAAAVGTLRAAELYGANVLDRAIEDNPNNETRFVVLAAEDHEPTGDDKTSLAFTFDQDAPGLLHTVLAHVMDEGINMAKIESRPNKLELGRYYFLLDLDGHRLDTHLSRALDRI